MFVWSIIAFGLVSITPFLPAYLSFGYHLFSCIYVQLQLTSRLSAMPPYSSFPKGLFLPDFSSSCHGFRANNIDKHQISMNCFSKCSSKSYDYFHLENTSTSRSSPFVQEHEGSNIQIPK